MKKLLIFYLFLSMTNIIQAMEQDKKTIHIIVTLYDKNNNYRELYSIDLPINNKTIKQIKEKIEKRISYPIAWQEMVLMEDLDCYTTKNYYYSKNVTDTMCVQELADNKEIQKGTLSAFAIITKRKSLNKCNNIEEQDAIKEPASKKRKIIP